MNTGRPISGKDIRVTIGNPEDSNKVVPGLEALHAAATVTLHKFKHRGVVSIRHHLIPPAERVPGDCPIKRVEVEIYEHDGGPLHGRTFLKETTVYVNPDRYLDMRSKGQIPDVEALGNQEEHELRRSINERGTGRTTRAMKGAPSHAVYIWCNQDVGYATRLAGALGRADLKVVGPNWIFDDHWRGQLFSGLVLDHAVAEHLERNYSVLKISTFYSIVNLIRSTRLG